MDHVDCVVIGAGVVGLAVARELALAGREVILVEVEPRIGTGTSSRNSGVIHAGIYYPTGSLKARLCVQGRELLYEYCEAHSIAHQRCGKLIVATHESQHTALAQLAARAQANGVHDLQNLTRDQAQDLESQLACTAALLSPSTGIVDVHQLMHQLLADAQAHGAVLAVGSSVVAARIAAKGIELDIVTNAGESSILSGKTVVNAAGLHAPSLARRTSGLSSRFVPDARFAKGNYFTLSGPSPFSRLVYPLPEPDGLGVHLALDLGGQARFGPDVQWLETQDPQAIDYQVDAQRADGFYGAIRRYWPALPDGALMPGHSGVRPKIRSDVDADFVIQGPAQHGVAGLVNLFGIESPGLTASLAIGAAVAGMLSA